MSTRPNAQLWALIRRDFSDVQVIAFVRAASKKQGARLKVPADKRAWLTAKWFIQDLHPEVARRYLAELERRKAQGEPLVRETLVRRLVVRPVPPKKRKKAEPTVPRDPLWRWRWRGGPGTRKPRQFG